ncbi:GFA family protein [Paracraurococcus ruber]|uniref:Aldehyde-activating protein n=2 Tax=Paracraurococcus ruber TaxID=77675 RepID=A0ABS1CSS7_9PROT|nr:GFA family protein [Paracraurococcus ruber]MBK1657246.1 aldehyde-activating protein [Paracraurococcus ruber]TDG32377.1 GFA family protein [Paracraurococcus ruber]
MPSYKGACFCGAVEIEVTGEPHGMGYCHCRSCRSWSAGPVNAFTLWSPEAVTVTKGEAQIGTFAKTDNSHRQYCTQCGGHLMTRHPPMNLVDVYAATIPDLPFKPGLHVFYAETVLPIRDGLPKFLDVPKEFGGSGEMATE